MSVEHNRERVMVLAIDLVGFSAMSELDEAAAVHLLHAFHSRVEKIASSNSGRALSTAGDGVVLAFADPNAGIRAASSLMKASAGPGERLKLRAGAHVGDVIVTDHGDFVGAPINIASRLCGQAAPDEFLVSDALKSELDAAFASSFSLHGLVRVTKATDPIIAHKFVGAAAKPFAATEKAASVLRKHWRAFALGLVALGALAAGAWAAVIASRTPAVNVVDWIETHPGIAAWVQALGSLLALVTALALPYLQRRTLERSRAQKVRPIVMDMWNAARDAYYFCLECDETLTRRTVAEQLTRARCAFEDCPSHELRETAIVHLFRARDRLIQLERRFESPDEDLQVTKVPATVRAICLAIVEAMEAESALSAPRQVRMLMTKLAEDTGLEGSRAAGLSRAS